MKGLVQIGVVAVVLFSVSAALSVWLYQSRQPAAEPTDADKAGEKAGDKAPKKQPDAAPKDEPKAKSPDAAPAVGPTPEAVAALRDREARLDRRAQQLEIVVADLKGEREAMDALLRQATAEVRAAAGRAAEVAVKAAPTDADRARLAEAEAAEKKNIERLAALWDAMAPETAAPILRQMADGGRMDTAVRVLAQMKDRQASRLLGELGDAALAAQLFDRMRLLRPGGAGTLPAGAPANLSPPPPRP